MGFARHTDEDNRAPANFNLHLGRIFQMRTQLRRTTIAIGAAAVGTLCWLAMTPAVGQAQAGRLPRTADGKPNLNGIWQTMNTANWDLEGHAAQAGPVVALGAAFSVPAGPSIVEGG